VVSAQHGLDNNIYLMLTNSEIDLVGLNLVNFFVFLYMFGD